MNIADLRRTLDAHAIGQEMYILISDLYPIYRSITGDGVRETLSILQKYVPLLIHEVPTGTAVFDWTIPREWNIRDAYILDPCGEKVVDFKDSNLHVVSYSVPIHAKLPLADLKQHLFTLPDQPEWIPYRTSYYKEAWGFCMTHSQFLQLQDCHYEILIDSSLEDGYLTYGEYYLPGKKPDEVLFSCHVCHPSLCNDNLSGVALVTALAKYLTSISLEYSYRFLFIPGTIGSITWLSLNEPHLSHIKHGLVIACVGDSGKIHYKKSRRGNAEIDTAVHHVLKHSGSEYEILEFSPYGYDERQFCSPGFNLPVGCFTRTPHGRFPQYHTSADNLDFVHPKSLADSFNRCLSVVHVLENNKVYINLSPKCEPQLGKRGLYRSIGGSSATAVDEFSLLWVLNLSDGSNSLLGIAERSGHSFDSIAKAAQALSMHGLLGEKEQ